MRNWYKFIVAPFVVLLLTGLLYQQGVMRSVELQLMDLRFSVLPVKQADHSVVLVDIDSFSLQSLKQWPWPRDYHAKVIEQLNRAGVKNIVFDLDFSSSTSPEVDAVLEKALSTSRSNIMLPVFKQAQMTSSGEMSEVVSYPLDSFKKHVSLVSINIYPDVDGRIRQMNYSDNFDGKTIPTIAAWLAGMGGVAPESSYYIDYSISIDSIPRVSFFDVMEGRIDPGFFAGASVVIGSSAIELRDQVPVPLIQIMPGPLLHIVAYQSLIQNRALMQTSVYVTLPLLLLCLFGLMFLFNKYSWCVNLIILSLMIAVILTVPLVIQHYYPVLITTAPLLFVTILSYALAMISRMELQTLLLSSQKKRMQGIVDNSFDGILTLASDGTVETVNPTAEKMFSINKNDVIGKGISELIPLLQLNAGGSLENEMWRFSESAVETTGRRGEDDTFSLELALTKMNLHDRGLYICFIRDITERKKQAAALEYQEFYDKLTGLPNRTLLHERVERAIIRGVSSKERFALLLLDLDNFKEINNTLGHESGDKVLIEIARRISTMVREVDTVARMGGDEFSLLLPGIIDIEDLYEISGAIVEVIEASMKFNDIDFQVSVSIGCALFPDHGNDVNTLLQRADIAMYSAKHDESRFSVYEVEKDSNSIKRLALRSGILEGISNSEFSLRYQPKIDLITNRIISVESLIRWQHPEYGFVFPDEFIPLAEKTGLIVPLTNWVLKTAVQDCSEWLDANAIASVAVNLSVKDLLVPDFPEKINQLLASLNKQPHQLALEVTESYVMADPVKAIDTLCQLHEIGVKLSIDDFGTGYSSLAYIKELPVDELKIDKSFVLNMMENKKDLAIVRATIDLAHNLGLTVVAEGVETEAAMDLLREFGCDIAQGYFISQPLPMDEFNHWMQTTSYRGGG